MASMLQVGIVGLPNVGKSTLFNALLRRQQALVANYPFATIEPNVGVIPVPDSRLGELSRIVGQSEGNGIRPPIVPATVRFVDIAGLVKGAAEGAGLGNKFLSHIREVDLICEVVRAFPDGEIIREGSTDPLSDIKIIETELGLADLETVSKLLDKKFIYVFNVNTASEWAGTQKAVEELKATGNSVVVIDAKLEAELAVLSPDEQEEYLASLGIKDSGVNALVREAYAALNLISFLTAGVKEVRAWPIPAGAKAPQAAGTIHTDFEKAFIKAEIVDYDDFIRYNGWQGARNLGKARIEGKDYIMKDGDVVEFKVNA